MNTIKVLETKRTEVHKEQVEYTYNDIRDLFEDDPDCLVIQLLNRVEELELRIDLDKIGDREKIVEELVDLRARNEELRCVIERFKDIIKNIGK